MDFVTPAALYAAAWLLGYPFFRKMFGLRDMVTDLRDPTDPVGVGTITVLWLYLVVVCCPFFCLIIPLWGPMWVVGKVSLWLNKA